LDDKPVEKNLKYIDGTVNLALKSVGFTDFVPNQKDSFCFFPISNRSNRGLIHLRAEIVRCCKSQEHKLRKVPLSWTRCLDMLLKIEEPWVHTAVVKEVAKTLGITSVVEIEEMLTFFEHLKIIIFLNSSENLRDVVVLDVQWLIDSICVFLRDPNDGPLKLENARRVGLEDDITDLYEKGLLSYDLVEHYWHPSQIPFLIDFMRAVFLLSDWKYEEDKFLLPSVVANEAESDQKWEARPTIQDKGSRCKIQFTNEFVPCGLFQRFVCLCVAYSSKIDLSKLPVLFANYAILSFGGETEAYIEQERGGIGMTFVNDDEVAHRFRIILSLLKRIQHDFKNPLSFSILVEKQDEWIQYQDARKQKLKPWFEDETSREKSLDYNLTGFLSDI